MNISFKHALVALDHSDASDVIVESLIHLKKLGTQKLTLFTSVAIPAITGLSDKEKQEYWDAQDEYRESLEAQGFDVSTSVKFKINSFAPFHILDTASDVDADYLILGNRGHSKMDEFLIGSTAMETLHRTDLPVFLMNLTVSDEKRLQDRRLFGVKSCERALEHILHPTDFSDISDRAFNVVKKFSKKYSKKVSLLHVQSIGRIGMGSAAQIEEFDAIDRKRLEKMEKQLPDSVVVDNIIQFGSASPEILRYADESGATMIIMGSQGRGYVREVYLGGVGAQVARGSKIPLLLIPAERDED